MNPPLFLLRAGVACALAIALAGCGGSDLGAPQPAPSPASGQAPALPSAQRASLAASFVVRVGEDAQAERFVVQITDAATIANARRAMRGDLQPHPVLFGELRAGNGGLNRDPVTGRLWSWHLDPDTVRLVDMTIEIYDGRPSDIEGDLPYWLGKMGRYAPWSNRFEREIVSAKKGK